MLGIPLFAATCIYCKCTKRKSSHICDGTNKQSRQNDKQKKSCESRNSNETTLRSNVKMNKKEAIEPLHDIADDDDDNSCYHIPGNRHIPKKVFRPMNKIPKNMNQKSINAEDVHIPKKVFRPMLKIPKSSRNRCLSQTGNQISSTSLLRRLVKYSGEKFHQTTRITRSILRKRFTNTSTSSVGLVSSKEVELSIKRRSAENFNSCVLTVLPEIGSVELGKDEMEYIDAEGDDPNCCRNKYTMKRGFRYLFNQEKLDDRDDDLDMGIEQKRGFFQKFFRPTSSRSLGGVEGTSTELEGRSLLHDNDNYAVIDKRQDEFVISINKDKREMSAPVSPKNVTFEDELSTTDRRGQSVAPHAAFLANPIGTTLPMQQAFNNFNYDTSQISTVNSRRDIQLTPARSSLSDREHLSPMSSSHEASLALDEATHDLLRLSSQPPSVWYSSSSRLLPAADRIPKSASTTSMNKVIRTEDGGMLKLANVFTWDAARLSDQNHDSSHNSAYVDDKGQRHQTVTVYDEKKQGPPIVRTTVEGKLKMEKVVGADLISVEHCICSAWTIRDIVTHYKVKTTLGKRTLILEEDKSMDGQKGDFKMSLYEDGQLKTRDVADLQIPSNADKANYLSQLSQRLLHDIEMLDQHEEPKITTRVEVEITENVTKILKTYIVGERNDLFLSVDQTATDATDAIRPSSDFKFLFEGHQYEDRSEIRPYQRADSDTTTTTESIAQRHLPPLCINVECNLKRIEDHSLNEVNVQMPNVFSVVLSLIRERIPQQLPSLVKYGMEQHGKQYSGETTIRRLHRYESTESSDELQTTMMQKERTFFFEKPERIEPVKIPVLNITELDLRRMADTSAILANFAIPRTDQSKLNIEHRYEFHEAGGRSYGMQQKGQHFEGEMILRKKRRFSLESESVSEEEVISGPTYLDLIKQEARGEFEVSIVLSNDERSSPKHFQASQSAETINLIAQISMDGKKEEVFAILAAKNKCKQVYMGQEIGTVTSNIMITMQKAVQLDDIFQQIIQRWNDKMVERIAMKISEFGNENEHVAVMLQRAGIMYGQVLSEWPEAVTGRLSITTTSSSSSTITTTNTFNIFEALTDSFGTNTGTDFLNTDLTNINTTTKRFHLPNFKTILPAYGAAQKIIPLINTCIVSMDLSNNYTQQIAKNSEEISVRIAHELDKTDKVEQQIDEEKVSLQMVVKTTTTTSKDYFKNDETEEQLEEMFDTFHIDRDTYMHEASIIMKPQSSRQNTHFSDQVKGLSSLSLHTIDECMQMQQNGTELSFTSDTHREHEKSPEQTISSMESTKKSSKTIDIPIIRMNETKTEDVSSTYKIFPKCKFETDEKRMISSTQIPTVASSNINSKKERLVGAQEQSNTEIKNANLHSVKTDSLLLFDLGRASDQPSGSMEYLNDSREMEEVFRESRSYFQNVRNNVNERQELMSRCSNIYEATATCNEVARSHEQLQYEQKRKRTHLQEFLYDIRQKEQQELRTFPQRENQKVFTSETSEIQKGTKIRIQREFEEMRDKSRESLPRSKLEREELKGKLYNGTSEMRVAMLHAGFNLDTTLLVTPEAMTQSKFARDYGATTSEYFSDERSWSVTTESYKQRNAHMEHISKSANDLIESSLEENPESFDEISYISDTTYAYMKHSKIGNTQMTRSLTTDLEATRLKECLIETENECSIIPEICNYDVTVRKSEQSESSSVVHSAKYHQPKQPRQTVEDAMKALTVQKKEETVLKLDESSENHRDLTSLKTTAKHFQVQVPSLGFEYQNEIFQPTTSRTTKIEETIEQMVPKSAKDKYITAVSTDTERVEISKQEVEYNHNKLVNHQAFPQTMSTSPKVIVEIPEQKISQTDSINTYDKVKRSVEQAWSETALLTNYDLVTTLQMSTATSEKIERQVSCEERNTQFDAVVHFPFKPMKKSLLREIAVIEKETSITRDEIDVTAKTPEVKILQQQRKTEEEFEQIRQFETVERQMTTVGTFRESEFLEEIEQIEAEELTKTEHESKQFYQIERRSTNVETDGAIQADHGDISDVSRLDLEMKKASIIENVVTESKLVNYHQTAMTTSAMKEAEVTCNTDLRYIFDETIKDEQRNITTDYRTVEREASVNKNVSEKDLTAVQMLRQTIQAESIDKSNFLADQEALPDTEVVVETLESEAATSNFTFSDEYKEQLLRKSEEKMEHITTVEIPNKEITIASTTEYNKEVTSLNGVFLRSVIQETVEQCTEIIADRSELRVNLDAQSISSEDVTQDIVLQGPTDQWTVVMVVPEEMTIQEYIKLHSTVESFITQQSILEKSRDDSLEISTSIKNIKTEKAHARHPETGHEEEALTAEWSKVVRKAWTEKVVPIGQIQAEKFSTVTTMEESVDFSRMIEKMESSDATELTHSLKEAATYEKQLMVTSETQEHSLLKGSFDEACSAVVPNLEVIQAQARIIEYGIAQIMTTGSFARLEHEEVAEKAEVQFAASVKLENHLETQFAASESVSLDIQLEDNCRIKLDEAYNIVQKPIAEVIMNLKAIHEEVDSLMSDFESQTEHLSCIGHVFLDDRYETISSRIHEYGSEQQQYVAHWDVLQNATSAETYVAVAELQSMACTVDAVKQEEVQIVEQIEHPEFSEFTNKMISFKPFASEIGEWKIVQGNTEAVFQQSDEQMAEEAINISDRYSEKQIGAFQEYGSISMETIAHFARILLKKTENNEAKISNNISRHWEEFLSLEASREYIENLEQSLVKVEPTEIARRTMSEVNRAKVITDLIASSEAHVTSSIMLDKQSQYVSRKIVLKDISREWIISERYIAQSEVAKLIDTTWSTVVNDFDSAININESNREQVMLNTVASQELQLESRNTLYMKPSYENASIHFPTITAVSGDERQFKIESEMKESSLERKQEALFAENVQKAISRAENLTESVTESSEVQSDAGVLLMRRSAKKTSEATSHVIGIALTLSQHLKTLHAQETSKEASVELSIPASNLEVEDNIRESVVNRGAVSLETKYAKSIALQETVELTKSRKVLAEAESILKGARTDAVREKLKETDSEGFEILSQWTTVDRDLEAEVRLQHARNIVSIFSTTATTEEEISISQTWVATECKLKINTIRNVITSERCQRSFQIEFDEMRIRLEKSEEEGSYEIIWCDKNYDMLYVSMHESILEKLIAVINLHRISNVLPKQRANEYIWRDQQFIAAIPLHIKCEDIETNYTNVDICLEQKVAQKYLETVRISANWMAAEIFECEQAGDERFSMLVEFEGKRLIPLGVEIIWPEARKDDGIVVDVEEYLEDQAILYAQLTSEQVTFAEFNKTVTISQDYEPQMLTTNSTKEEVANAYDEFRIPSEAIAINHAVIIGNKGEHLSVWLQETKQDFVIIGFQYIKEIQAYEMEGNFVEKRFGGNYQLITKATKTEDRNTSMAMLRRIENETVREVLKENVKNFASMEVLASTSKATLIEINWQKAQQMQTASTQLPCSRKAEPIRSCFLEIGETMHTVHAQFKIKESSWKLPIIWKVPNYGGHLTLNTESTEETLAYHEIDYHKDEAFEVAVKTLKEVVTVMAPVLSTQHITEVMQEIRTDLIRPSVIDEAHLFLKQANKGINIEAKLIEATDVRQTSYLQFAREVESVELEKIIREARFGGKLNFITCAAEEYELNAVRELTSSSIRIAHCSQLIISKNWNRGTYCEAIATTSESADVPVILRSVESTDDAHCIVHQKPFMRNSLTIQESEALVLIINLNYVKERAKEISEKMIWLRRNAEPCILATFATTEEQKLVQWIVEKRRDTFLSASTIIKIKNIVKALPLETIQSETVEITICPNLQRIARMLEVCKTLIAPNRGYDMFCKLHETCDENEFSNYQFKQENGVEQIEAILPESCYGGHSILNTSAMKESVVDLILRLESKLPTEDEIYFSTKISNRSIPVVFSTKSTVSVESNEIITLERKLETGDVAITQKIANIDTVQMTVGEISLETESIILKYQHKEEHIEIQKIIFIALYGGHQKLETLATSEIIANICEDLISKHLMFAEACLHQTIANVANPCILSVQSSKFEESNEEYCLRKKLISESETALVLRTANYEFAKFITAESTDEIETITTHWQRDETSEKAQLCMKDKLFGGSVLLSTHFAQDSTIVFTAVLSASHSTLERVIFAIPTARHSMEHPILATSCTTEMHTEISCNLNRPLIGHQSTITIQTANQIEPVIVELTESTIISETTNIQYQRPNAVFGEFSEVFPEIRFGGSLILNTLATKETMISVQSSLSFQGPKQLEMQMIIMDKNRATEMCHMLASTEKIVVINIQFQKASDLSSVETTKRASRRGEDRCITLTEPTEINEFSNFSWEHPTETSAGQIITLKEMRFGGRLELSTKHAGEQTTTITHTLTRTLAKLDSTISRKTANRGESISISCPASQENYVSINLELQSKKLAQFEVSMRREAANRGEPQKLITNEFSELMLATNVTMQKTLDSESTQTMWKAKNQGGIIELRCNASKESYAELYNCLESKLSLKQQLGVTLMKREVRYGEHIAMNLMATEETIFNFEASFEKQDMESNSSHTIKAMNVALPEVLETKESVESAIGTEKLEVWRRISAVHVESVLKLARECLPVSLQTDSAQETFIRHEAEMRVDVQRTDGKVEIEKSASILEHEALVCAEAVNVTLRHKLVDEGQEEKVEKRVSFAAEVTEKTMSMDMSVTVEQREIPMIVKKPMKKEQHGRRPTLRQNEAPNFVPVRRNSLLLAMELTDGHNIPHYKTLEDIIKGIKKAGLEYSNLIFGIDYTKSNKYQGERTFDGRNLHALSSEEMNPYQQVIEIVGKTLSSFDADGVIPTYGFGDEESSDYGIFNLCDRNDINAECNGFEEVLKIYNEKTPLIRMSGPTNFVPLIEQAVSIVREKHSYHILVIVADGQVTNEKINQKAIAAASRYPLSIIMVGVGDGPWNMMTRFDETLPKRMFDNFHFVDFHKVMFNAPNQEASFALNALMEIPDQYKAIKELGLLKQSRRG